MSTAEEIVRHAARREAGRDANALALVRRQQRCSHQWGPPVGEVTECVKCGLQFVEEEAP